MSSSRDRRFTSSIYTWGFTPPGREAKPSARAVAEAEARKAIPDTRTTTGRLLGDPPPGRSALDVKRERERIEAEARRLAAESEGQGE